MRGIFQPLLFLLARSAEDELRRQALRQVACGFGHVGLLGMLHDETHGGVASAAANPLSPRMPHFTPKASRVIFLFMHGGVSHVDTFAPKPMLTKYDSKPLPFERPLQLAATGNLMKSPWKFRKYGDSGLSVSELFPHIASMVDEISFIRSMHVEQIDHGGAACGTPQ